jgi:hypothetical protein
LGGCGQDNVVGLSRTQFLADVGFKLRECEVRLRRKIFSVAESRWRIVILRETGILIVIGLAAGVPASLACARLVQSTLFGLKPADPLTLGCALGVMLLVAAVSSYLPARRGHPCRSAGRAPPRIAIKSRVICRPPAARGQ